MLKTYISTIGFGVGIWCYFHHHLKYKIATVQKQNIPTVATLVVFKIDFSTVIGNRGF